MPDRYYLPDGFTTSPVSLTGGEFHHLAHVMRRRGGDEVELFDGNGRKANATIIEIKKKSAMLEWERVEVCPPNDSVSLTLAVCVPKGDRFRWLVEKAAELGVRRLIPLITQRSVVKPGQSKLKKARQWAIEAAKQCGSAYLLEVGEPVGLDACLEGEAVAGATLIADPAGSPISNASKFLSSAGEVTVLEVTVLIGPEGGWTPAELRLAVDAGSKPVSLGNTILRTETAAVTVAAIFRLASRG